MTGAEHYQEAQRLLAVCAGPQRGTELDLACTAAAQVHATLALAAATALKDAVHGPRESELAAAWIEAAGTAAVTTGEE
jgi:hypothetical protein